MTKTTTSTEVKRAGKFGLVGILNTLIDYVVFIALTKIFQIPLDRVWVAKFISGAVAMTNSFILNRTWVFHSKVKQTGLQAVKFLLVTLIGVFVIQTGLVQFFSSVYPAIGELAYEIARLMGIIQLAPQLFTVEFVIKTVAFGIATLFSMVWNYVMYKKVVF